MSCELKNRVRDCSTSVGMTTNKSADATAAYGLPAHNRMKISRMIRAADERPGCDIDKTFRARNVPVVVELFRGNVFNNRQMLRTRAQVLTHCQDFAAGLAQIIHGLKKLGFLFAKAEHYSALCHN